MGLTGLQNSFSLMSQSLKQLDRSISHFLLEFLFLHYHTMAICNTYNYVYYVLS